MIERLISFFKQSSVETKGKTPEGVCPVCWGHQEYDNKIRKLYEDKQIDVNNHAANFAFIQGFVAEYISGIVLIKNKDGLKCPICKTQY